MTCAAADGDIGGTAPKWGTPNTDTDPLPNPPGATDRGVLVSGRLSRLTVSGNTVTGETVLINDWAQQFPSHSIGSIQFGPDGALYASGGDGASSIRSPPDCVFGKAMTSRMFVCFENSAAQRSMPSAMPPWGGAP